MYPKQQNRRPAAGDQLRSPPVSRAHPPGAAASAVSASRPRPPSRPLTGRTLAGRDQAAQAPVPAVILPDPRPRRACTAGRRGSASDPAPDEASVRRAAAVCPHVLAFPARPGRSRRARTTGPPREKLPGARIGHMHTATGRAAGLATTSRTCYVPPLPPAPGTSRKPCGRRGRVTAATAGITPGRRRHRGLRLPAGTPVLRAGPRPGQARRESADSPGRRCPNICRRFSWRLYGQLRRPYPRSGARPGDGPRLGESSSRRNARGSR